MQGIFIFCAAAGGTVLVVQFLLALVGLGGHVFDVDVPHDIGHDFGGDFHGDTGGGVHDGSADDAGVHHDAINFFRILSFRTVVAAMAFFGLSGLAAQSAGASTGHTLFIAIVAGGIAMTAVYWMMRGLRELYAEGTVRIQRAVGEHGLVYLRVPAAGAGSGKIQLNLQNRTMEYLAVTAGPELPTGAKVVVTKIVNPTTLEVQAE